MRLGRAPLVVFDMRDPRCRPFQGWPPLIDWMREHGVAARRVFRVELVRHRLTVYARFHRYAEDAEGRLFLDPDSPDDDPRPAVREPLDVPLRSKPPELDIRALVRPSPVPEDTGRCG